MNYFKTFMLIFILTAFFMIVGFLIGGSHGAFIALLIACAMNLFAYWNSDKLVLRMYNAKIADKALYLDLYFITENLVKNANLPMPKLYVMDDPTPNAFATGRNPTNSAVAVTTGICKLLSLEELEGVIAHELAHVKNRDTLISTIVAVLGSGISMICNMFMFSSLFGSRDNQNSGHPVVGILLMVIAPLIAGMIQMAVSRSREYIADATGAKICNNPLALASALQKLELFHKSFSTKKIQKQEQEATAHLFIINPLAGGKADNLFSTHPNTANRVKALENLAKKMNISTISVHYTHHNVYKNEEKQDNITGSTISNNSVDLPKDDDHIKNNPWK